MTKIQHLQYLLILSVFRIITLIPIQGLYVFSAFLAFLLYNVVGYRKKVVFENLQKAFPNRSNGELLSISKKYYKHLAALMVENVYFRFASKKNIQKRFVLENREVLDDLYSKGKNIIGMLGHVGNWELPAAAFSILPYSGVAVYKQLSSVIFDKIYFDIRTNLGIEPVEMRDVLRTVVAKNAKLDPYILCMIADQAPLENEKNHWLSFLNQDTDVYTGSEKLAIKYNMAVVYVEMIRTKLGFYRMVIQLITETPKETKEFEITETYFQLLEQSIIKNPPYWLWSHRRWKHKRA